MASQVAFDFSKMTNVFRRLVHFARTLAPRVGGQNSAKNAQKNALVIYAKTQAAF